MKCKSWSSKINNYVVRHLKSIKINGQQQQQQQQGQPQQQYLSTCSTMPAMPKEKASAVSLSESNFSELKLKELATAASVVAAMATTATSRLQSANNTQPLHHIPSNAQSPQTQQHQYRPNREATQQQQQQQHSVCSCNTSSAEVVGSMKYGSAKYVTNGQSSPLADAVASSAQNGSTSSPRNSSDTTQYSNGHSCYEQQTTRNAIGGGDDYANAGLQNCPVTSSTKRATLIAAPSSSLSVLSSSSSSRNAAVVTPPKKSPKDFIFGKYIGEGSFSSVYLAVDVNTKREYAIKVCEKRQILREHKQEYVGREREVMHMMTNVPGFVNLSCTFQDSRSLFFVMTYAKNGDLLPYITKVGSFDVDCTRHYAAELVLACEQMHRRNVVHRDLKPENILLDENMHTLIADFGSAKILTLEDRAAAAAAVAANANTNVSSRNAATGPQSRASYLANRSSDDDDEEGDTNDTGSDEDGANSRRPRYHRRRKGSFVGTAQYVSPEVLQNGPITPAADLWALGCIVYQMISGLPPFRGSNDYVIFREILACNLDFPSGFDKNAEDLVRKLLKVKPEERWGAQDFGGRYESIRSHPFFEGIDFDAVRQQTPPPINPYLPGVSKDEAFSLQYHQIENMEPGLDDKQRTRLLGLELGTAFECESNGVEKEEKTVSENIFDLSDAEKQKRLGQQKSDDKWHAFADNEVILRKGFVNKRKGLFARKRMLLLTTGPRLIYIDPVQMIKKGEIPWSADLRVEPKNFKIFFVHTPNRTYYLEDPDGYSLEWVAAIENMHNLTYSNGQHTDITSMSSVSSKTSNAQQRAQANNSLTQISKHGVSSATKTASN